MRAGVVWGQTALALALVFVGAGAFASPQTTPLDASSHHIFLHKLVAAAIERTHHVVRYDPAYVRIAYPGGDVPADTGVCTDEVIRAYRAVGVDLQKEVHEDMVQNFSAYPHSWKGGFFWLVREWMIIRPEISSHGIWEEMFRTSASLWTGEARKRDDTCLFITSVKDRRWKMFCSTGRLPATIDILDRVPKVQPL